MRNLPPACVVETFDTVDDLLNALSVRNDRWRPSLHDWVFRGQGNSTWNLVPTALRDVINFELSPGQVFERCPKHSDQVNAELYVILKFAEEVNRQGLTLPSEDSYRWLAAETQLRNRLDPDNSHTWPPTDLEVLIALAQHHGVPTRLLDWTERPLVAAYFAALQAVNVGIGGHLSIWALNPIWANFVIRAGDHFIGSSTRRYLRLIRTPRATNENLHAQAGAFTCLMTNGPHENDDPDISALDELLVQCAEAAHGAGNVPPGPVLRRMDLDAAKAGQLLRYLYYEGVSATTLFPGYDGVVKGLRERGLWDTFV